jgi:hypothetical protein
MTVTDGRRRVFVAGVSALIGVRPVYASVEWARFVTEWLDSEAA